MRVELYPLCLTVYKVDEYGMPLLESKLTVPFSRSDTLLEVISQLRPNLGVERELPLEAKASVARCAGSPEMSRSWPVEPRKASQKAISSAWSLKNQLKIL